MHLLKIIKKLDKMVRDDNQCEKSLFTTPTF